MYYNYWHVLLLDGDLNGRNCVLFTSVSTPKCTVWKSCWMGSDSKDNQLERHGKVAVIGLDCGGVSSKDLGKRGKQKETSPEARHTPIALCFSL